jgi:predicted DCC family thiol-disulfide oxidoreductase YuxK
MSTATFTTSDAALLPLTVYYDHSCLLCRSEIENLSVRVSEEQLKMVDCSGADFDSSFLPFDQKTLMNSIHALDAKGEWLIATDVFVVCYRAAQLQKIAKFFAFSKPLLEKLYPFIAKHRGVFSFFGVHKVFNFLTNRYLLRQAKLTNAASQACRNDECKVGA